MPFVLSIRNFQSIASSEIEVSGLTALVGPNNIGKSAVCRAAFGVFTNARGSAFVRWGEPFASVRFTFSDGRSVKWEKGPGVNRYELDGKNLDKVGLGPPPELESLGVLPLTGGDAGLWPQFAPQFTGQVFLLDRPGSVLAEAISDVRRVGVLNEALRLAASDKRSALAEAKVRTADSVRIEKALERYEGLDEVLGRIAELEKVRRSLSTLATKRDALRAYAFRRDALRETIRKLSPVRELRIPESNAKSLAERFGGLEAAKARRDRAVTYLAKVGAVREVFVPDEPVRLRKIDAGLSLVRGYRERRSSLLAAVLRGREFEPALGASAAVSGASSRAAFERVAEVRGFAERRKTIVELTASLKSLSENLSGELRSALEEVETVLAETGACPVCGREGEEPCR